MKKSGIRKMVFLAVLTALSAVLGRLMVIPLGDNLRISLMNIPIIIASLWFGPVAGAAAGAASDIIGANFLSAFGWFPPLTLTPVLFGVLPWFFKKLFGQGEGFFNLLSIILLTNAAGTMFCSTVVLHFYYGADLMFLFAIRIPFYCLIASVETAAVYSLEKSGAWQYIKRTVGVREARVK